jgi:hypothetical protein
MLKLLTKFKGIAMINIQDGSTISLWHDMWKGKVRESEALFVCDSAFELLEKLTDG